MFNYSFTLSGYEGIEFTTTLRHEKTYTDEEFKAIVCQAVRKVTRKRKHIGKREFAANLGEFADKIVDKLKSDFGFEYAPIQASFWEMYDLLIGDLLNEK